MLLINFEFKNQLNFKYVIIIKKRVLVELQQSLWDENIANNSR